MPGIPPPILQAGSTPVGDVVAPGNVTLGTPTGAGVPYTLPSLPAGAGSLILQCSNDDATWNDIATGLAGGATGTLTVAYDGSSAAGHQNELTYFRAKNTNGGLTGSSTNATTVDLPGNFAAAPTIGTNDGTGIQVIRGTLPTNAISWDLNGSANVASLTGASYLDQSQSAVAAVDYTTSGRNIYGTGTSSGDVTDTTANVPDAPDAPANLDNQILNQRVLFDASALPSAPNTTTQTTLVLEYNLDSNGWNTGLTGITPSATGVVFNYPTGDANWPPLTSFQIRHAALVNIYGAGSPSSGVDVPLI